MKVAIVVLAMLIASCGSTEGDKVQEAINVCSKLQKDWSLVWNGNKSLIICDGGIKILLD